MSTVQQSPYSKSLYEEAPGSDEATNWEDGLYGNDYDQDTSWFDEDYDQGESDGDITGLEEGATGLEDPEEAAAPQLDENQERLVKWLEEHNGAIHEKRKQVIESLQALENGEDAEGPSSEEKLERIEAAKKLIRSLEQELKLYNVKEGVLEKTGVNEEDVVKNAITDKFESQIDQIKKDLEAGIVNLEGDIEATGDTAKTEGDRKRLAKNVRDLQGHLVYGEKFPYYYGGAWFLGRGNGRKYIFNTSANHASAQVEAKDLIDQVADAIKSGDSGKWESLTNDIKSRGNKDQLESWGFVYNIIQENYPSLWTKVPGDFLNALVKQSEDVGFEEPLRESDRWIRFGPPTQGDERRIGKYSNKEENKKYFYEELDGLTSENLVDHLKGIAKRVKAREEADAKAAKEADKAGEANEDNGPTWDYDDPDVDDDYGDEGDIPPEMEDF